MGRLLDDGRLDDMRLLAAGDIDADRLFKEYGL